MPDKGKMLERLHRVRTLQLNLAAADEARAQAKVASESALSARIESLSASVQPQESAADAFSFIAAAHYRERLNQSAFAAVQRVKVAETGLAAATAATREAKRDQSAIEKLIEREDAVQALKELRALEAAPPVRKIRHDPC